MKLFETSQDVFDFISQEWENTETSHIGASLKVISTNKAKQVLKLSKANPTTEYLIRESDVITLIVYETAFDMLSDLNKTLLLKGIFSLVSFDLDKDRIVIDNRPYADLFNMRHSCDADGTEYLDKYDNALENAAMAIESIEEEERKKKEEEKERKAAEREAKRQAKQNN
jgi:hypothetical protein